jgi:heme exporter protein A
MNTLAARLMVDDVHVWRGDRHVLQGISFALNPGDLLQVSGPNGAGKTTLLRTVCGLLAPEVGEVRWQGSPIQEVRSEFQGALAFASHEPALKADLTAIENLRFAVGLKRRFDPADVLAALEQVGAQAIAHLPARVLSAGQRRRVALARLLALRAQLWLLDEPFANLDAAGVQLMSAQLDAHLRGGGMAIVAAHHELGVSGAVSRLELAA